jgi:hypothetical protein
MKKIRIYKDLEHQRKIEIEQSLKESPAERIAQVVALIRRIYPIRVPAAKKKIQFLP